MNLKEILENRVSVRHYLDKDISREDIMDIVAKATLTESWKNAQTARYHIVVDKEKLAEFRDKCLPEYNAKNCMNAPALVVTSFKSNRSGFERDGSPSNELGNGWGIYDAGLHNQTLILAAAEKNISSLVMGLRDEKAIREMLNIEEDETIISVISLGYAEKKSPRPKRKDASDIVKFY